MSLYETILDYSKDVFRNIPSIKPTQNLFDDLSDDTDNWEAANNLEIATHSPIENHQLIQRGFEYSENTFIDYPFENLTESRFSDGRVPCWYASETLKSSVYETVYHFVKGVNDSIEAFVDEQVIETDRRVAITSCIGLAIDLSSKVDEFPWLIDPINYSRCQEIGNRIAKEGHPLLRVKSARDSDADGINIVALQSHVLSNVREYCFLKYSLNLSDHKVTVYRGDNVFMAIKKTGK